VAICVRAWYNVTQRHQAGFLVWLLACLLGGVLFAEVYGYGLHRLMHSDVIAFTSRNHMIHHLKIYGPRMKQRPEDGYRFAVAGRANLGGIGMEWLVPIGLTIVVILVTFRGLGATWLHASVFLSSALFYSYFLFWLLHNAMHQRVTWMLRQPWLRRWFLAARHRHDVHHVRLDSEGRLYANFGIGFAWMDHVFGTAHQQATLVEDAALARAHDRYREVVG
jgi:sterol desaturase/sphingolipid hydroxylase (fatty acid hydroxylase superfamily)